MVQHERELIVVELSQCVDVGEVGEREDDVLPTQDEVDGIVGHEIQQARTERNNQRFLNHQYKFIAVLLRILSSILDYSSLNPARSAVSPGA